VTSISPVVVKAIFPVNFIPTFLVALSVITLASCLAQVLGKQTPVLSWTRSAEAHVP